MFAVLGVGALYVLAVAVIARGLQLVLGAIGTLFAGMAVFILLNFPSSGASLRGHVRRAAPDGFRPSRVGRPDHLSVAGHGICPGQ